MDTLDKAIGELTETDWEVIRLKLWHKLGCFVNVADREDAAHDALLRLADMLDQDKPLRLLVHVAARREIDHCSPQTSYTLPNGKRRIIRGAPTYRPMFDGSDASANEEDDRDGLNQPRDWQALSFGEIVEAGLVSAKRERIAG